MHWDPVRSSNSLALAEPSFLDTCSVPPSGSVLVVFEILDDFPTVMFNYQVSENSNISRNFVKWMMLMATHMCPSHL